jgi:hypothetical protein
VPGAVNWLGHGRLFDAASFLHILCQMMFVIELANAALLQSILAKRGSMVFDLPYILNAASCPVHSTWVESPSKSPKKSFYPFWWLHL